MGDPVVLDQPLTLEERFDAAAKFRKTFPVLKDWPVAVDNPEGAAADAFDSAYSAWPTRFYVIDGRHEETTATLLWRAEPHADHEYKLKDLVAFLESLP